MTLRYSNSRFLTVLEGDLREGIGWEVVVRSYADFATVLAHVFEWQSLSWTKELNGPGTGSITLDLDADTFQVATEPEVLLDAPNLWQFYYNGVLRHEWIAEKLDEALLESSEVRTVTISGPGSLSILSEALVLPPNYPVVPPFYWTFENATMASRWLAWLEAAQARGLLTMVEPQFTAAADTRGIAWTDSSSTQEPNGDNLLTRLTQIADLVQADFTMHPGFKLDMQHDLGFHREAEVVFYPLSSQLTRGRKRDRAEIRNTVIAQDAYGALSITEDAESISKWRRREAWVAAGNALDNTSRDAVANAALAQLKKEAREWTLKVEADSPYRVFYDYNLADWVGVDVDPIKFDDPSTIEVLRIVGMAATVEADGVTDLELTLETLRQTSLKKVQSAIDKLGGDSATVTAATPISVGAAAAAAIASADLTDLADVTITSPANGSTIVWNEATSQWEDGLPSLGGFKGTWSPAVAYPAGSIVVYGDPELHYGTTAGETAGAEPGVSGTWVALGGGAGAGGSGVYRLGNSSTAGAATALVRYRHYAQQITVTQDSVLHAIEIYCQNNGGNPFNVVPGVFVDNAGTPGRLLAVGTVTSTDDLYVPANTDTPYGGPSWLTLSISAALEPGTYWIAFYSHDSAMADFGVFKTTGPSNSSYYWTASGKWLSPGYTGLTKGSSADLWSMRAVLSSSVGPAGPAGSPGADGSIWVYKGAWNSATAYVVDDVVSIGGATYVAVANNTNSVPPSANWQLVAAAGLSGVFTGTTPPTAPFTGATSPLWVDTDATMTWYKHAYLAPRSGPSYTLVLTDDSKTLVLSHTSQFTVTVPTNASVAFPVGTQIDLLQTGTGQVVVEPAGGVTLGYTPGNKIASQWQGATLLKTATDTWVLLGALAA